MSLRVSLFCLKRKAFPMGLSKRAFHKKLRTPGSHKPWIGRQAVAEGEMVLESSSQVHQPMNASPLYAAGAAAVDDGARTSPYVVAGIPPPNPTTLLSDVEDSVSQSASLSSSSTGLLPPSSKSPLSAPTSFMSSSSAGPSSFPAVFAPNDSEVRSLREKGDSPDRNHNGSSSLPFGKQLQLNVESVETFPSATDEGDAVPAALAKYARSGKNVAETTALPKHLNKLFHKIMKWTNEATTTTAAGAEHSSEIITDEQLRDDPLLPKKKLADVKQKTNYGLLMGAFENDQFAIENKLQIAGDHFERKFVQWEGMHVHEANPAGEMEHAHEAKSAVVMQLPSSFHIPRVNHDPCPGCGATIQNKDENAFGYVRPGQVEEYIVKEQEVVKLRSEYADRMAELQRHWETHGRRVGEEWLDFMTQDEFNAIHRHQRRPFVCHRCNALENMNVVGRRKVMSAPDFTEKLRALKERRCTIVLVVDATDFPGSMVYDLPGLISMNNKVIIAVNKCDCIRPRSFQYKGKDFLLARSMVPEHHIRKWAREMATQFRLPGHQIAEVVPISAKRGWNIDKLLATIEDVSNLNLLRPTKPLPTYFVGVANVGKSSVINAIAHHLYVPQPPHPESKKVYFTRTQADGKETVHWRWYTPPNVNRHEMIDIPSRHDKRASKLVTVSSLPGTTVAATAVRLSLTASPEDSTFFFDTPGLFPHWHRTSPLTLYQMRRTLIRKFRNPMCFVLLPGHTLFLGGLAAIDVVKGCSSGLLFMVYTSAKVKSAIVDTEKSDEFWAEQLGKALDPPGDLAEVGDNRLTEHKSYLFECFGKHRLKPKADVYVCGLGWVAFCTHSPCDVVLRVRTLPGVVHGVREPLRRRDLKGSRRWPKLRARFKASDAPPPSVDKVIKLTAKELIPGAPSMTKIERTPHPRNTAASATPFEEIVSELHQSGKM